MTAKHFCDDCRKEAKMEKLIKFWLLRDHPLENTEFCFDYFAKHWKPVTKKFSLVTAHPKRSNYKLF